MKQFKKIYIETTNICNLSCNFCPKTSRKLTFMKEDAFVQILEAVKPHTKYVYLHLMGEPLLNTRLGRFLEISEEHDIRVNLTTNGTLINKAKPVLLAAKALRQINISLHSFEANEQVGSIDDYVNDIISFINEAGEVSDVICSIRLWNMDTEELKANNELNNHIFDLLEKGLSLRFSMKDKLQDTQSIKINKKLYINMAEKFEWPDSEKEVGSEKIFCHALRDHVGVHVDGTVVPCCLDSEGNIPLGNILEQPLQEIIDSKRAKAMYDGFSRRCAVEDLCKKCGYATRYTE